MKHRFSENALFWMTLFLLVIGAFTNFYQQGKLAASVSSFHIFSSSRTELLEENLPASQAPSPRIYITLSASDSGAQLNQLLTSLSDSNIKITISVNSSWMKAFPQQAKWIQSMGHDIRLVKDGQ